MGQKVNPNSFRLGPTLAKTWDSILYTHKYYKEFLIHDLDIRSLVNKNYDHALVSKILIERPSNKSIIINIFAKNPKIIIGKGGYDIGKLKIAIQKLTCLDEVYINVSEIKKPNMDASIISQTIAIQLKKRVSFRKAMKGAIQSGLKQGALGLKISCSGRLAGSEIARTEWYREGRVPLHTLRANIDYAKAEVITTYGVIGVQVWVYKGEHIDNKKKYI